MGAIEVDQFVGRPAQQVVPADQRRRRDDELLEREVVGPGGGARIRAAGGLLEAVKLGAGQSEHRRQSPHGVAPRGLAQAAFLVADLPFRDPGPVGELLLGQAGRPAGLPEQGAKRHDTKGLSAAGHYVANLPVEGAPMCCTIPRFT